MVINVKRMSEDGELIECAKCGEVLNEKSLWVVCRREAEPQTMCEQCYVMRHSVKRPKRKWWTDARLKLTWELPL